MGIYESIDQFNLNMHNCMRTAITEEIQSEEDRIAFNKLSKSNIEVFEVGDVLTVLTSDGFDYFSGDHADRI